MAEEMVLYHMNGSRSTRALWMYKELQTIYGTLPPLRVHVFDPSTFRETKPEWYLAINPNGKVPAFTHGKVVMFDSSAICLYLLQMFDKEGKLAPMNQPDFAALLYQLAFYCSGTVDNLTATSSPIQPVMSVKNPGDDEKVLEVNHSAWIEQCGPLLVSNLGSSKYIAGDSFTAVDVIVGVNMHYIHRKRSWHDFPVLEMSVKNPGDDEKVLEVNHRAWIEQCGPLLVSNLGSSKYIAGDSFTAVDVIVGVNMHYIHRKRSWHDFPVLEAYFERLKERTAFQEAFEVLPFSSL